MRHTHELDFHPASAEERVEAFGNVFDVWRHADTLDEHLAKRLSSPQHNRADWFVGCLDGRVVVSMGCYPMQFDWRGRVVNGIAIGSVHTVADYRGRGYAAGLLRWVEEHQAASGAEISLLFSDIKPEYYAKLGYALCPAWEGWIDLDELPTPGTTEAALQKVSLENDRERLIETYANHHRRLPFFITRDEAYWSYLFCKAARTEFYWVTDSNAEMRGFVAFSKSEGTWFIKDWAVDEDFQIDAIAAMLGEARGGGVARVGGWLPAISPFAETFQFIPRTMEITMIKPLKNGLTFDREILEAAGHLHEIDHV